MYDAEALSGKSLAELREIGKKLGIKAQMRKQALIDKILEQSERPESGESPLQETSPAETPQSDHPVPQKRERRKKINAVKVTGVGSDTKPETELPIPSEPFFAENAAGKEKKQEDSGWINAGFMVLEPEILDLIEGDATVFEKYPLEEAARRGQLDAYRHNGFWQCMDTMNEKKKLEEMWRSGNAPWKVWE